MRSRTVAAVALTLSLGGSSTFAAAQLNGPLPSPFPLFPADNWWNVDVSGAPVDSASAAFMTYMSTLGPGQTSSPKLHPDFGGINLDDPPDGIYGFPYIVVDGTQAKKSVQFLYSDESDGVDHTTNTSFPFYPIPDEAITQPHWIESGQPGNQDLRDVSDRHMFIVDHDHRLLYELYNVFFDGANWQAGSGALFNLDSNARRPEGWTSADAAGLAMLPGLVRYDEVFGPDPEIQHAFRVTVQCSSGHVYPGSHTASTAGNPRCQKQPFAPLPMGARLRLKAAKDISGFAPEVQKIFRAMKKHGLIVADNGSDLFVSGTFDTRWNNDVLNPAFGQLSPSDFEVVEMAWKPGPTRPQYRLYHTGTKEHLYTTDYNEYATLGTLGWAQEGIAYQLFRDTTPYLGMTPTALYRLYHPGILQHLWTTDANEKSVLAASGSWTYEGVTGYLLPTPVAGSSPLLRMSLANPPLHLWTSDQNEYNVLQTRGWIPEGAIGYVIP